jgi:Dolichyl-phosphate-mannose-protein mannosyltransferase
MWAGGRHAPLLSLVLYGLILFALRPATPFEWDEVLFQRGLDHYDVAAHSPHPPGYPVYIAAARVVRGLVGDPLLALQLVAVLSAMATLAVMWRMSRQLGAPPAAAAAAAAVVAVTPAFLFNANVGLSDVPGTVAAVAAVWLLVRSVEVPGFLPAAAAVSALAAGVRPQLVAALAPALVWVVWAAVRKRRWRRLAVAFGVGAVTSAACWLPAIVITGPDRFWEAVLAQWRWVGVHERRYHLPGAPLGDVLGSWLVHPFGSTAAAVVFWALVAWGSVQWVRRGNRKLAAIAGATAGTYLLAALWSMNFTTSVRYILPAVPFLSVLAAGGLVARNAALRRGAGVVVGLWCVAVSAWTWPALRERLRPAPVWAALTWIRGHFDPGNTRIGFEGGIAPHVDYVLGRSGFRIAEIGSSPVLDEPDQPGGQTLYVTALPVPGAELLFKARYSRRLVEDLERDRYGSCTVNRMRSANEAVLSPEWQFRRDGWHLTGTGRIRLPAGSTPALVRLCAGWGALDVERPGAAKETLAPKKCVLLPLLAGGAGEISVSAPPRSVAVVPPIQLVPLEALRPASRLASTYMVPQVAHVPGSGGAFWRTDLLVINPQKQPLRIAATFLPTARDNREAPAVTASLAPGQILSVPDVLARSPFKGSGPLGAMLVRAAEPSEDCTAGRCGFLVVARTYNSSVALGAWRSEEWLRGVPPEEAIRIGDKAVFGHVIGTGWTAASLGLASWSAGAVRVRVVAFDDAGRLSDATIVELPAFGHLRLPLPGILGDGRVEVEPVSGPPLALVVAYVAMVDRRNGLPTYLLPGPLPERPLPEGWVPPAPLAEAPR